MVRQSPFRKCLWCGEEIERDRMLTANFCKIDRETGLPAKCRERFRAGLTTEQYHQYCELNLKKPIRDWQGNRTPGARKAHRQADNNTFHICKLGELKDTRGKPLCNRKFLGPLNKLFCCEAHQQRHWTLTAHERHKHWRYEDDNSNNHR